MSAVAVDRIDGDVGGQLNLTRVRLPGATLVVCDAERGFALLWSQEGVGQGKIGRPISYLLPERNDRRGECFYPLGFLDLLERLDLPQLISGLELAPFWGCRETGNPICWGPRS